MVLRAVSFGMLNQAMTTWFGIHCTLMVSPWRHVLVGQLHHGDQGGRGCHPKDVEDWKWICTRPESCVWQYEHWKWMKSNELRIEWVFLIQTDIFTSRDWHWGLTLDHLSTSDAPAPVSASSYTCLDGRSHVNTLTGRMLEGTRKDHLGAWLCVLPECWMMF